MLQLNKKVIYILGQAPQHTAAHCFKFKVKCQIYSETGKKDNSGY